MVIDGKIDTIIGKETEFKGTLTSTGMIRIDGRVEGEIIHKGDIAVGDTGNLNANIKARNVTVAGTVTGNIDATGRLELLASARVFGDISIGTLVIGEGALFRGSSEMKASEKGMPGKPDKASDKPA
jgi:cytoskeletal protein CcmA (bactofilin family)